MVDIPFNMVGPQCVSPGSPFIADHYIGLFFLYYLKKTAYLLRVHISQLNDAYKHIHTEHRMGPGFLSL